jgi:uncharacterized membrane protein YbhN (UPF0104 family)
MFDQLFNRRTRVRWLLGVALLAALLVWVETAVGWGALLAPWRDFPPADLVWLLGLTALSYFLRAVRVYDYSHRLLAGRLPAVVRMSVLHNTLNNLLPMRLGELAYPWLMKRYFGQGYAASGTTLVWIRLLDLHFLVTLGLGFLALAPGAGLWIWLLPPWLALLPAAYLGHGWLQRFAVGRSGRVFELLGKVLGHVPENGWGFFRAWLWTVLSWACKFAAFTTVVMYFAAIPTWQAVLGTIGAELSTVLPVHGVAGSGSYELAMAAVLLPLGIDMSTVLKGAVNLHLYLLGSTVVLAAAALLLPRPHSA